MTGVPPTIVDQVHDPVCQRRFSKWETPCPECDIIRAARADERIKADRQRQREVEATAQWCRADERETIAAALEDLGYDYPAEVARGGGSDE